MSEINWKNINAILELDPQNKKVIDFLVNCVREEQDDTYARDYLKKIVHENKYVIDSLLKILEQEIKISKESFPIGNISWFFEIAPNHPYFIELFSKHLEQNDYGKNLTNIPLYIKRLEHIAKKKKIELKTFLNNIGEIKELLTAQLINLIENEHREDIRKKLLEESLSKICPENPLILKHYLTLEKPKESNQNKLEDKNISGYRLFQWLENVNPNCEHNEQIAKITISWMQTLISEDDFYRCEKVCQWLAKVNFTDESLQNEVVEILIYLLDTLKQANSDSDYSAVLNCLGEVAYGNQKAIDYLVNWINNPDTRKKIEAIESLAKITAENNNNSQAINAVIGFIRDRRRYQLDITLNALATIDINNNGVIYFLLSSIKPDGILRYDQEKVFNVISQSGVNNHDIIERLIELTYHEYTKFEHRHQKKKFYQSLTQTLAKITTSKNELMNEVIEAIFWWMNQYLEENSKWESRIEKWSIEIESLTNFAPQNELLIRELASFLPKLDFNHWPDFFWDDEDIEKHQKAINGVIFIGKDQPSIIEVIGKLMKIVEHHYSRETKDESVYSYFLNLLLRIDTQRKMTTEILVDILNNFQDSPSDNLLQLSYCIIFSLNKLKLEDEALSRSLASALIYGQEIWNYDISQVFASVLTISGGIDSTETLSDKMNISKTIYKYLEKSKSGKVIAVETLSPALQTSEINYEDKKEIITWLIKTAPAESQVIDILYFWLNEKISESQQKQLKELWIKSVSKSPQKAIQNLEKRLQVLENNFQSIESALLLFEIDLSNDRALEAIIFLLKNPNINNQTIDRLIELLDQFHTKDKLKKMLPNQLQKIVAVVSQLLNSLSPENCEDQETYEQYNLTYKQMLWYCTQNLAYPNFYQAYKSAI